MDEAYEAHVCKYEKYTCWSVWTFYSTEIKKQGQIIIHEAGEAGPGCGPRNF